MASPNAYFPTVSEVAQEAPATVQVEVDLDGPVAAAVAVPYTVSGTARCGRDFAPFADTVTVPAGATRTHIKVPLLHNDDVTGDVTVVLTLAQPSGANLGANLAYTLTVHDVDTQPEARAGDLSAYPTATVHGTLASNILDATIAVRYSIASQAQSGNVTLNDPNTGAYTYAAGSNLGTDSFTFTATALGVTSAAAAVTVHVVQAPVPLLTPPDSALYQTARGPLQQGVTGTFTAVTDGNATGPVVCYVSTAVLDPADPSGIPLPIQCNELTSLVTDANGVTRVGNANFTGNTLTWTPTHEQRGTFLFGLTVPGHGNSQGASFAVTVQDTLAGAAPDHALDAALSKPFSYGAGPSAPGTSANMWDPTWPDLTGDVDAVPVGFAANSAPWGGQGNGDAPYWLALNPVGLGSSDSVLWPLNSVGSYRLSAWVAPQAGVLPGAVLLSNLDPATGTGLTLRQSAFTPDTLELWAGSAVAPTYRDLILEDAPNAYWRFEEATTPFASAVNDVAVAFDSSVLVQQPGLLGGFGAGFNSSSTPPHATCALLVPTSPLSPQGQVTVEAWVSVAALGSSEVFVSNASSDSTNGYALGVDSDRFTFALGSIDTAQADVATASQALTPGTMTHLAGTYDGTLLRLYVNGDLVASAPSSRVIDSDASLTLGAQPDATRPLTGTLDEVAVYAYALSPVQLKRHFSLGRTGVAPLRGANAIDGDAPVAHWPLNEASGTRAADNSITQQVAQYGEVSLAAEQHDGANAAAFSSGRDVHADANPAYDAADATFEVWLRPDWAAQNGTPPTVFSMDDGGIPAQRIQLQLNPNSSVPGFDGVGVSSNGGGSVTYAAWVSDRVWHHLVFTESHGMGALYLDGALAAPPQPSPKDLSVTGMQVLVGDTSFTNGPFLGSLQDAALYDYPLSPVDVARHYRHHGQVACQSHTRIAAGLFHNVTVDFNTTNQLSTLWVDGRAECVLPTTQAVAGSNLVVGADPNQQNLWSGSVALLQAFTGTVDSVRAFADFASVANRFRRQPQEDITAPFASAGVPGPVYSFDAANAQGLRTYLDAAGNCVGDYTTWNNLGGPQAWVL